MDKLKRIRVSSWVMPLVSPGGGIGVIVLAAHGWRIAAYALYVACMFLAVVYGASMEVGKQGGSGDSA